MTKAVADVATTATPDTEKARKAGLFEERGRYVDEIPRLHLARRHVSPIVEIDRRTTSPSRSTQLSQLCQWYCCFSSVATSSRRLRTPVLVKIDLRWS